MTTDLDRALIALRVSRDHGHGAALNDAEVRALLAEIDRLRARLEMVPEHPIDGIEARDATIRLQDAEIDRLTRERDEARAERDALRDVLLRHGFVPCDIPACNCGSWHARFGYPERLREIADALDEAGHPLSNENGNMPLNALRELIAERDAMAKDAARLVTLAWPDPFCDEYAGVDLHEQASIYASACGREEPNCDDYVAALRDAIDAQIEQEQEQPK